MRHGLGRWLTSILLVLLVGAGMAWQVARNPAKEERGISQERLDEATGPIAPGHTVGQTFRAREANLKAIELMLVVYDAARPLPVEAHLELTLERLDRSAPLLRATLSVAGLKHNDKFRFAFAPLADSQGATYRLIVAADEDYGLGLWRTSVDAYAWGQALENGEGRPGDLYLATFYDYHLTDILADLARGFGRYGRLSLPILALLLLPGLAFTWNLLPRRRLDPGTHLALAIALSLSFWPLALLWAGTLRLRLTPASAWGLAALSLAAGAWGMWRRLRQREPQPGPRPSPLPDVALLLVLLAVMATRFLEVRALVLPAWVDSLHHTLITQLIAKQGVVPASFQPYVPGGSFHYHFGFHAVAAALSWLGGLASYQAVLILGQLLNALAALSAYALATGLTRRRWAGVGAAVVAGALSSMPAYYVSWGRYTELAGLVLLGPACLAAQWLLAPVASDDAPRFSPGLWVMAALLGAGLFLTHYRVLIFYLLFFVAYLPLFLWRRYATSGAAVRHAEVFRSRWTTADETLREYPQGDGSQAGLLIPRWHPALRLARDLALLGMLALLLVGPWLWRMLARVVPGVEATYGGWELAGGASNAFALTLLDMGLGRTLLYIALGGSALALLRRQGALILLGCWVGLWLLAANLHLLGLKDTWLLTNEAVLIAGWLPISILCGSLVEDVAATLGRVLTRLARLRVWRPLLSLALGAGLLALTGWGGWRLMDVVNSVTVLATEDDLAALEWAAHNTPPEARFLINTRVWQSSLHAGEDGGWWLPLVAQRQVTLPPVVAYQQGDPNYRQEVLELAEAVEGATAVDDPAFRELLVREHIRYVYSGARGGRLMPRDLDKSPFLHLRYSLGPVRIYEFVPQE